MDIVILSNTISEDIYKMNCDCISSIFNSEGDDVIFNIQLIESNKESKYVYDNVIVLKPKEQFGYNLYLNLGLKSCTGDFVALCNNDLLFEKGWLSAIYNISIEQPDIKSFSPIDDSYFRMKKIKDSNVRYECGHNIKEHIAGWCIVIKHEIVRMRLFDNQFDFYFADDDYAMNLYVNRIKHALVVDSRVKHLEGKSTEFNHKQNYLDNLDEIGVRYPKYLRSENYSNITHNSKMLSAYLNYHKKWGGYSSLFYKRKLVETFPSIKKSKFLMKLLYSIVISK